MKKLLLFLTCFLAVGWTAKADTTVAFVADGATYEGEATQVTLANNADGNLVGETFTSEGNCSISFAKGSASNNTTVNSKLVRWYQSSTITLAPATGKMITKAVVYASSAAYADVTVTPTIGETVNDTYAKTITWTGNGVSAFTLTARAQTRFSYIEVTCADAGSVVLSVETPKAEVSGSALADGALISTTDAITLTCSTEGATIHYSIDGGEEADYSEPFTVKTEGEHTLSFYATKEGLDNSDTVSVSFSVIDAEKTVIIDFSKDWGFPTTYKKDTTSYTDGTYTITCNPGKTGDGWKKSSSNLLIGKTDASIDLPVFDFPVEQITFDAVNGASVNVNFNIYVGDTPVSTACTGVNSAQSFKINPAYQTAGTQYTVKLNNNYNAQFHIITIYKGEAVVDPVISVQPEAIEFGTYLVGDEPEAQTLTVTGLNIPEETGLTYSWEKGEESPFAATGELTAEGGTLSISLKSAAEAAEYTDNLLIAAGTEATATVPVSASIITLPGEGEGTLESPYNVTRALSLITLNHIPEGNVYVSGEITGTPSINTDYGNATYYIVDVTETAQLLAAETTTSQLMVYRGFYSNDKSNKLFTSEDQIKEGDKVVVCGTLIYYNNQTPEINKDNYIVTLNGESTLPAIQSTTIEFENASMELTVGDEPAINAAKVMSNGVEVEGATITYTITPETVATIDATTGAVTAVSAGSAIVTATFAGNDDYSGSTAEYVVTVSNAAGVITAGTYTFGPDWNALFGTEYDGTISKVSQNSLTLSGEVSGIKLTATNGTSTAGYVKTEDFRVYKGYTVTFEAPTNYKITDIKSVTNSKTFPANSVTANSGTLTLDSGNISWTGEAKSVALTITGTGSFKTIDVTIAEGTTGIENIETVDTDNSVMYFNLQGQRVNNPTKGIYIRVNGNKAEKVIK